MTGERKGTASNQESPLARLLSHPAAVILAAALLLLTTALILTQIFGRTENLTTAHSISPQEPTPAPPTRKPAAAAAPAAAISLPPSSASNSADPSSDLLEAARNSVVLLAADFPDNRESRQGTGFFLTAEGHILTAYSAIAEPGRNQNGKITAWVYPYTDSQAKEPYAARLLQSRQELDLALVKIEKNSGDENFRPLPLGDDRRESPGSRHWAIGYPGDAASGTRPAIRAANFTGWERDVYLPGRYRLNHRPPSSSSSGRPLLNRQGCAIGISIHPAESPAQARPISELEPLGWPRTAYNPECNPAPEPTPAPTKTPPATTLPTAAPTPPIQPSPAAAPAAPTPYPTGTPYPTQAPYATAAPYPTPTPRPTVPAPPTPTPLPTATPAPTPTPTPPPTATPIPRQAYQLQFGSKPHLHLPVTWQQENIDHHYRWVSPDGLAEALIRELPSQTDIEELDEALCAVEDPACSNQHHPHWESYKPHLAENPPNPGFWPKTITTSNVAGTPCARTRHTSVRTLIGYLVLARICDQASQQTAYDAWNAAASFSYRHWHR